MTDKELMDRAISLVLAMMRSASRDRIDPRRWWEYARNALEAGAGEGNSFPEMVSVMAGKLLIDATTEATAKTVEGIEAAVEGDFEAFRSLCERQAVYVVAMAQAHRAEQREEQANLFTQEMGQ